MLLSCPNYLLYTINIYKRLFLCLFSMISETENLSVCFYASKEKFERNNYFGKRTVKWRVRTTRKKYSSVYLKGFLLILLYAQMEYLRFLELNKDYKRANHMYIWSFVKLSLYIVSMVLLTARWKSKSSRCSSPVERDCLNVKEGQLFRLLNKFPKIQEWNTVLLRPLIVHIAGV